MNHITLCDPHGGTIDPAKVSLDDLMRAINVHVEIQRQSGNARIAADARYNEADKVLRALRQVLGDRVRQLGVSVRNDG